MATRAKVTSVEALEAFRSQLIIYLSKARPTLDEVSDEVARVRGWLESDRRVHWEGQVRRARQKLQDAQQAVFSAELSNLKEVSTAERMAVQRAKRALEEAETKLARVKKWNRNFANEVMPIAKQLEKLQVVFTTDLPEAISSLGKTVRTLQSYSEVALPEAEQLAPARDDASTPDGSAPEADTPASGDEHVPDSTRNEADPNGKENP